MSRLAGLFAQLQDAGRAALIPFMTAGDPSLTVTVPLMHALVAAGADAIELGMPFSDPMADGPSIQRASERALARGVKLRMVLEWVREFRTTNSHTPIILMGYLNPVEAMGITPFAEAA
ncbi:MAG TPA: tryptophan synthase subunit alpha, partial [Acidithiobacillus sp.]|nr:tryptophan synthase subunit alpha [Acidithiobacillus sp.]